MLSEDYGMLHMMSGPLDSDRLWQLGPIAFGARTGTDARFGRKTWSAMRALGLQDLRVDYAIVDTLRVDRGVFAGIINAWRDGYSDVLAEHAGLSTAIMRQHFDEVIASIGNPDHYAVWFVPVDRRTGWGRPVAAIGRNSRSSIARLPESILSWFTWVIAWPGRRAGHRPAGSGAQGSCQR